MCAVPAVVAEYRGFAVRAGTDVCHESVRLWWNRLGPVCTADIRRQGVSRTRGFRHWRWHLDDVFVKINGERH